MRNHETRCDYRIRALGRRMSAVRPSVVVLNSHHPAATYLPARKATQVELVIAFGGPTSEGTAVIFITKYLVVITLHLNGQRLRAREISVKPKYHRASRRAFGKP